MIQTMATKARNRAPRVVPALQRLWMHADAATPDIRFVGLNARGGAFGPDVEAACELIRHLRPRQVMLETCDFRRDLVTRAAKTAASSGSSASGAGPPTHTDVVNALHGGLPSAAVVDLLNAAEEVGAKVYSVDRPYRATQNSLAQYLVSRPGELLQYVRHTSTAVSERLAPQDAESSSKHSANNLEVQCPGVNAILVEDREKHMAACIARWAVSGNTSVIVACTDDRVAGLQRLLLQAPGLSELKVTPLPEVSESRLWPSLLVLGYVMLPASLSMFLTWRLCLLVCGVFEEFWSSSEVKVDLPEKLPEK